MVNWQLSLQEKDRVFSRRLGAIQMLTVWVLQRSCYQGEPMGMFKTSKGASLLKCEMAVEDHLTFEDQPT